MYTKRLNIVVYVNYTFVNVYEKYDNNYHYRNQIIGGGLSYRQINFSCQETGQVFFNLLLDKNGRYTIGEKTS